MVNGLLQLIAAFLAFAMSLAPTTAATNVLDAPPTVVSGTASNYGPGYNGLLALPQGPGYLVTICGPAGPKHCVTMKSNDTGPVPSLHRVADLDVPTFEAVCGCKSWTKGLVHVTITFLGPKAKPSLSLPNTSTVP